MTMPNTPKLARTIRHVLSDLVRRDYTAVEAFTGAQRLDADGIKQAISDYGRRLVLPPDGSAPRSVVEIEGSVPQKWSVYVDLWTAEEGRSDLTLELTVADSDRDIYAVQIDNIHVL